MMNRLTMRLADALIGSGAGREEDRDIYVYGLDVLLSTAVTILCILAIGLLIGRGVETLVFLAVFTALRNVAGGYHAETHLGCFCITLAAYAGAMLCVLLLPASIVAWFTAAVTVASLAVVLLLAPVPHPNRPVTPAERLRFRRASIALASSAACAILLCLPAGLAWVAWPASLGMLTSALSMVAAVLTHR